MSEEQAPSKLPEEEEHLKQSLGFGSALVIGLASTAPAYSLAAVIGFLALDTGVQAPAVLILSFIPMLLVATAYYYMNRADPDCGTTFAWATRAMGPTTGWLAGWAIMTAGVIVIGLLAQTAATYTYYLFSWDAAVDSQSAVIWLAVAFIVIATYLCVRGIEISARTQNVMIVAQIGALLIFAVVALIRVWTGDGVETSVDPTLSWFNPLDISSTDAVVAGVLTGIFIYWGWDSAVTVNEESADSNGAGKAAVVSTAILVGVYLLVATACVAWLGAEELGAFEDETAFNAIAGQVFTSPLDKLVILAVLTSALAATQTTVLPSSRTALSMGRRGAGPKPLAHIHTRYLTPDTATWLVGILAIAFYVGFSYTSEAFYGASLDALGLLICINYGLNGLACAVYYRRELFKSAKNFFFLGLAPLTGALILGAVLVKSIADFTEKGLEDTTYWFGLQAPLVVTIGLFIVALAIIIGWRTTQAGRGFFARKLEVADPALLAAHTPAPEGRA